MLIPMIVNAVIAGGAGAIGIHAVHKYILRDLPQSPKGPSKIAPFLYRGK